MRIRSLHVSFLIGVGMFWLSVIPVGAQSDGPVLNDCTPRSGSINSVLTLEGYRLGLPSLEKTKPYLLQNGKKYPARTDGGSSTSNNETHGPQDVDVIVPEGVVPGPAQIVVEVDGHRSAAVTITIVEWALPVVARVAPASGPPGSLVNIECSGFHINDEIELTDALGKVTSFEAGGSRK